MSSCTEAPRIGLFRDTEKCLEGLKGSITKFEDRQIAPDRPTTRKKFMAYRHNENKKDLDQNGTKKCGYAPEIPRIV